MIRNCYFCILKKEKMIRRIIAIIIITSIVNISSAQRYNKILLYSPLKGTLQLAGNFGEFRTNHFHAGVDLRTGTINHPIYAVADGYVSRIKVSGDGYGNALYLTIPKYKLKILYGHLNKYCPALQSKVKEFQNRIQEFQFDMEFDSTFFPVKKGQFIAYSGTTGRSFGPHLHFEIRNLNDEPINPQLFNLKIEDTKAPRITKIAIFPANDSSYVNNSNSPKYYILNGSLKQTPIVHGSIYFGVEAFDYLNNVSSRNAYYSTKMFVDNKLFYYSKFDSISYLHNRDVNSMVDYPTRLYKGWRIQKTYVEPNNELFHYVKVKNNGIVEFNDNNTHTITIVVGDIYGNTTRFSYKVKSSTSKKKFKINKNYTILRYDTVNTFSSNGIEIYFPEKSLFDNVKFQFKTSYGSNYSPLYHIGNEQIPIKEPFILSLNASLIPDNIKNKTVICRINGKNNDVYKATITGNYASAYVQYFGNYYLDVDTIAPTIKLINKSASLKFKVRDDLSGIADWAGFINGQWAIFAYDAKNDLIYYYFDEKVRKGTNKAVLLVKDKVGNIAEMKLNFVY